MLARRTLRTLRTPRTLRTLRRLSTEPEPPRLPSKLQTYAPRLHALSTRTGVPLPTLAVSFLVLHELTAIVPVVGFYYLFSAIGAGAGLVGWIASASEGEGDESWWRKLLGEWYDEGRTRAEKVGKKYGLLGYDEEGAGANAGAAVANAVAAYVVVKVSSKPHHSPRPSCHSALGSVSARPPRSLAW